jgi:uncharacterized membrane protein (UPF0136 family)
MIEKRCCQIRARARSRCIIAGYAILILLGGIIGYLAAGSIFSLLMSGITAAGLGISAYFLRKKPRAGIIIAYAIICLMALFFTYRFWITQKIFPGAAFTAISLGTLVALYLSQPEEKDLGQKI